MAVKIFIKRTVPKSKEAEMIPIFTRMRSLAVNQPGYISGETLKRLDQPDRYMVISTWQSDEDWKRWFHSEERTGIQSEIDILLGHQTDYETYYYPMGE